MSWQRRSSRGGPGEGRPGWWAVGGVVAAAVVAVVVVVLVSVLSGGGSDEPQVQTSSEGKIKGDSAAPVAIIEYADFQCSHCREFATTSARLIDREYVATGLVSVEFRSFAVLGEASVRAAEAAECVNDQGEFWEYHDILFENQGAFSDDRLKRYADELGLDHEAFDTCLDGREYLSEVLRQRNEGEALGVSGTPYFFINGQVIAGNQDYEVFEAVIEEELAKSS